MPLLWPAFSRRELLSLAVTCSSEFTFNEKSMWEAKVKVKV